MSLGGEFNIVELDKLSEFSMCKEIGICGEGENREES